MSDSIAYGRTGQVPRTATQGKGCVRLYAAGERDFRGANLRGQNFHRADLSGADFSGADIRSARFVDATLRGVRFCGATGGLQRRWVVGQLAPVLVIAALAGLLQGLAGALIAVYLVNPEPEFRIAGVVGLIVVVITFVAIARQGFTLKTLGSVAVAVAGLFLSWYINRRIRIRDSKFENLRVIGLAFSALGGTRFSGADLTEVLFTTASFKSTNFANSRQRATIFHHIRWHQAQKLDRARLGSANLQDPRVLNLLTTLNGNGQNFSHANLEGANLAEAELRNANLCGAKLSRATLQGAQLHQTNLTEAQCIGTDFTAAQLTGATLDAWSIDDTTMLTNVDCDFVYLKEKPDALGSRERLPHNPDKIFEAGDFEKYFKEVMDEVKLLIRGGVDPQVFKTAFQALMGKHNWVPSAARLPTRSTSYQTLNPVSPTLKTCSPNYKPPLTKTVNLAMTKRQKRWTLWQN